jgi:hypothetical protein
MACDALPPLALEPRKQARGISGSIPTGIAGNFSTGNLPLRRPSGARLPLHACGVGTDDEKLDKMPRRK